MLSSIMQIFLQVSVLQYCNSARSCRMMRKCKKWLTRTWNGSILLISVPERKHTDHIHLCINFGTHKHHLIKQGTTQCTSPVHVKVPQFMGSLNTCIMKTYYMAQCWEQDTLQFELRDARLEMVENFDLQMSRHGSVVGRTMRHSHRTYIHNQWGSWRLQCTTRSV